MPVAHFSRRSMALSFSKQYADVQNEDGRTAAVTCGHCHILQGILPGVIRGRLRHPGS